MACKIPDKTIAVSDILGEYSRKKYNIDPAVIYNGARIEGVTNNSEILGRWNLKSKKYIVFVGRLIRHKGIHYLIEAFKKISEEERNSKKFKLVIVGDGFHTDDYVKQVKKMAQGDDNIIFTGNLEGDELREIFSNAYLFVQPSENEGLSIALLEAMGYGVPVLVSDIEENTSVVKDMGFTFKSKNAESLSVELEGLLNDGKDIDAKAERAKKEVESKYDWANIAEKTEDVYREVLESKK